MWTSIPGFMEQITTAGREKINDQTDVTSSPADQETRTRASRNSFWTYGFRLAWFILFGLTQ